MFSGAPIQANLRWRFIANVQAIWNGSDRVDRQVFVLIRQAAFYVTIRCQWYHIRYIFLNTCEIRFEVSK
ncbi:hypothetical protein D3C85_1213710 [compost metagenome]